jgi:hypothetical protein
MDKRMKMELWQEKVEIVTRKQWRKWMCKSKYRKWENIIYGPPPRDGVILYN